MLYTFAANTVHILVDVLQIIWSGVGYLAGSVARRESKKPYPKPTLRIHFV